MAKYQLTNDTFHILNNYINYTSDSSLVLTCGDLDRDLYNNVAKVFDHIGGKWDTSSKVFVLKHNVVQETLAEILSTKIVPDKNPFAFFPTPEWVVDKMLNMLQCGDKNYLYFWLKNGVLEPSAGTGAIAKKLAKYISNDMIDVIEIDPINQAILNKEGFNLVASNFMKYKSDKKYDAIFMNPPFKRTTYIKHIFRAYNDFLPKHGEIVSVVPQSFIDRSSKMCVRFKNLVEENGYYVKLPSGTFSHTGTNVETAIVYINKFDSCGKYIDKI